MVFSFQKQIFGCFLYKKRLHQVQPYINLQDGMRYKTRLSLFVFLASFTNKVGSTEQTQHQHFATQRRMLASIATLWFGTPIRHIGITRHLGTFSRCLIQMNLSHRRKCKQQQQSHHSGSSAKIPIPHLLNLISSLSAPKDADISQQHSG